MAWSADGGIDIETTGKLWIYRPMKHKTEHHGHAREIFLGPKAQALLMPALKPDLSAFIFDPRDAEQDRRREQHANRQTPLNCGNRPGRGLKRKPIRRPGARYTVESYRRAINRACDKADPKMHMVGWFVAVTTIRIILSLAPTPAPPLPPQRIYARRLAWRRQVMLGHKTLSVTQLYAEKR